jgi:hypothetical protein
MVDLVLITEDKNDVFFLRDFVLKNYCNSDNSVSKKLKEKEYLLSFNSKKVLIRDTNKESDFLETGGWTKLEGLINSDTLIKLQRENEDINFVSIFDADEDKDENIKHKNECIDKWQKGKNLKIERFYLPFNNNESLNLEQLLELSFNKSIIECWNSFMKCIINEDNSTAIEPKSKKGKIIIYKDIYSNFKNNKNEYLSEMWNLDVEKNIHLKPLKTFLDQYLLQNE